MASAAVESAGAAAPPTLTPEQIAIVKSTAPILKERGAEITSLFYGNMLNAHPELRNVFNRTSQTTGAQPRALASAVVAYATYIDNLPVLRAAVERIAHKHVSLVIQPDQYAIVGKHLIEAVAAVLGPDVVTPAVGEAWTNAYAVLADVFVNREAEMYATHKDWPAWRKFKIARKERESSEITSFYLAPEDRKPLPSYLPGQYVSVRVPVPELGVFQPRQYSLSEAPKKDGEYYRIGIKRDPGSPPAPEGLVSNLLHQKYNVGDLIEVTHPAGEFFVDPAVHSTSPLVLISAGVGVMPMVSILDSFAASKRPISFIHGARNSETLAFGKHVRNVAKENPNVLVTQYIVSVKDGEVVGTDYDLPGRMDLSKLKSKEHLFLGDSSAEYYICGPLSFMHDMRNYLVAQGVDDEKIHLELFGVGDAKE